MPRAIRKLITGSELYSAWNLGYLAWGLETFGTPVTGKDTECEYFCPHCHDHSLTSEEIKASDEYLERIKQMDGWEQEMKWLAAQGYETYSDDKLREDQINDYYEYSGMADLARELWAEEETEPPPTKVGGFGSAN